MSSSSTSTSTSFQFAPIITTNTIRSRSNSPLTPPIDLVNPLPNMSVFIPHMFLNINETRIRKVFDDNQIGQVERVDFVAKLDKMDESTTARTSILITGILTQVHTTCKIASAIQLYKHALFTMILGIGLSCKILQMIPHYLPLSS